MMFEDHQHGNPIHKPRPIPPSKPIPPFYLFVIVLVTMWSTVPPFAIIDNYVEGSVEHVNGTVTDFNYYGGTGGLQNDSDPISWIEVDGKKYVARDVKLEGFGDVGHSLRGDYKIGDPIERDLFPYRPYAFFNDTPGFMMLFVIFPMMLTLLMWTRWRLRL